MSAHAEGIVRDRHCSNHCGGVVGPQQVVACSKYFAFLPHPNAHKKRKFASILTPDEMSTLQDVLGASGVR